MTMIKSTPTLEAFMKLTDKAVAEYRKEREALNASHFRSGCETAEEIDEINAKFKGAVDRIAEKMYSNLPVPVCRMEEEYLFHAIPTI
jgi:hypothetical protein